jgi:hypothetical protein
MNLEAIRTRLEDLYGPTDTVEEEYYDRLINDAYKDLCAITNWWFLEKQTIIRTSGYKQTIEVDATLASTALTPASSALLGTGDSDNYDGGWLKTGNHVYRILTTDNSIGDIILDAAWIEASDSDASVDIWNDIFDLPTDFSEVISVIPRSLPGHKPLRQVDPLSIDAETVETGFNATEHAEKFCIFKETDKDTSYKIRIYPPPDQEVEYVIKYIALPDDLASSADEALLPEKFHSVLSDFARLRLVKDRREDPDVIQNCEIEAQKGLQRLWRGQKRSSGISRKFGKKGSQKAQYMPFRPVNVNSESP